MSRVEGGKRSGKEEKNFLLKGVESEDKALCIEKSSSKIQNLPNPCYLIPNQRLKIAKKITYVRIRSSYGIGNR